MTFSQGKTYRPTLSRLDYRRRLQIAEKLFILQRNCIDQIRRPATTTTGWGWMSGQCHMNNNGLGKRHIMQVVSGVRIGRTVKQLCISMSVSKFCCSICWSTCRRKRTGNNSPTTSAFFDILFVVLLAHGILGQIDKFDKNFQLSKRSLRQHVFVCYFRSSFRWA